MNNIEITPCYSLEEMLPQFELIRFLTPDLNEETYSDLLQKMIPHCYAQIVARSGDKTVGVSGFWIGHKLYSGPYLEVDNFVVAPDYRNQGVGKVMLDWLTEEGKRRACRYMMLDAYVENFKAHGFYYREGFIARGFHFLKKING
ncbi:MAG TPA: GNAT family N-acetyltransferase [Chitinophagaceae bacterium]|nr:GNAT family N-acetyltransferase [Chitinophagaceae bacterium]